MFRLAGLVCEAKYWRADGMDDFNVGDGVAGEQHLAGCGATLSYRRVKWVWVRLYQVWMCVVAPSDCGEPCEQVGAAQVLIYRTRRTVTEDPAGASHCSAGAGVQARQSTGRDAHCPNSTDDSGQRDHIRRE